MARKKVRVVNYFRVRLYINVAETKKIRYHRKEKEDTWTVAQTKTSSWEKTLERDKERKVNETTRRVQVCDTEIVEEVHSPFLSFAKQLSTTTTTTTTTSTPTTRTVKLEKTTSQTNQASRKPETGVIGLQRSDKWGANVEVCCKHYNRL